MLVSPSIPRNTFNSFPFSFLMSLQPPHHTSQNWIYLNRYNGGLSSCQFRKEKRKKKKKQKNKKTREYFCCSYFLIHILFQGSFLYILISTMCNINTDYNFDQLYQFVICNFLLSFLRTMLNLINTLYECHSPPANSYFKN